jgi:hypothetical protein
MKASSPLSRQSGDKESLESYSEPKCILKERLRPIIKL